MHAVHPLTWWQEVSHPAKLFVYPLAIGTLSPNLTDLVLPFMIVISFLLTDGGRKYLELMACSNPVLYYELAELLVRNMQVSEVAEMGPTLLFIPDLLVGPGHPQLLSSWQHYKAYVSAFASWTKALVHQLTTSPPETVAEPAAVNIATACKWMMEQAQPSDDVAWGSESLFSWAATEETKQKPKPSSTQLLLLLLVSRPITAAAWKVLGLKAKPRGRSRKGDRSSTQDSTKKSLKQRSSKGSSGSGRGRDMGGQASSSSHVKVVGLASSGGSERGDLSSSGSGDLEAGGRQGHAGGVEAGGCAVSDSRVEIGPQRVSGDRGSEAGLLASSSCEVEMGESVSCIQRVEPGGQSSNGDGMETGGSAGAGRGLQDVAVRSKCMAENNSGCTTTSKGIVLEDGAKQDSKNSSSSSSSSSGAKVGEQGSSSSTTTSTGGEAGGSNGSATNTSCWCESCTRLAGRVPRLNVQLFSDHIGDMMESSPMLGKLLIVAVKHFNCLRQWHETSSWVGGSMLAPDAAGAGGQQLPAAAAGGRGAVAAAGAPGVQLQAGDIRAPGGVGATVKHVLGSLKVASAAAPVTASPEVVAVAGSASDAAGAGRGGDGGSSGSCGSTIGSGGSSTAAPLAAAAGGGVKPAVTERAEQLPKRLSALPQRGLPAAVMQQINGVSSRWSDDVLQLVELPAGEAEQQQLLQELLGVFEVLQEEVPMPVGCGNPMCTSLGGDSELAYKKTCMGCNVVHYGSRECQVAHWESHKGLCKRMQQEQKVEEGQKQQTGKKKG